MGSSVKNVSSSIGSALGDLGKNLGINGTNTTKSDGEDGEHGAHSLFLNAND